MVYRFHRVILFFHIEVILFFSFLRKFIQILKGESSKIISSLFSLFSFSSLQDYLFSFFLFLYFFEGGAFLIVI